MAVSDRPVVTNPTWKAHQASNAPPASGFSFRLPGSNSTQQRMKKPPFTSASDRSSDKANGGHTSMDVDTLNKQEGSFHPENRAADMRAADDGTGAAPTALMTSAGPAGAVAASDVNGSNDPPTQPGAGSTSTPVQEALFKAWDDGQIALFTIFIANSRLEKLLLRRTRLERDVQRFGSFWKEPSRDNAQAEIEKLSKEIDSCRLRIHDLTVQRQVLGREFVDLIPHLGALPAPASVSPTQPDQVASGEVAILKRKLAEQELAMKSVVERLDRYTKKEEEISQKLKSSDSSEELAKLQTKVTVQEAAVKTLSLRLDQLRKDTSLPNKPQAGDSMEAKYKKEMGQMKKLAEDVAELKSSVKGDVVCLNSKIEELDRGLKKSQTSDSQLQGIKKDILESSTVKEIQSSLENLQSDMNEYKKISEQFPQQQIDKQFSEQAQRLNSILSRLDTMENMQRQAAKNNAQQQGSGSGGFASPSWAPGSGQSNAAFPQSANSPTAGSNKMLNDAIVRLTGHENWLQQIQERLDKTTSQEQAKRFLELTLEFIPQMQDRATLLKDIQSLREALGRGLASVNERMTEITNSLQEVDNKTEHVREQVIANMKSKAKEPSHGGDNKEVASHIKALQVNVNSLLSNVETLQGHHDEETGQFQSLQKQVDEFEQAILDMSDVLGKARALTELLPAEEVGKFLPMMRQIEADNKAAKAGPRPATFTSVNQPIGGSNVVTDRSNHSTKEKNGKLAALTASTDLGSSPFAKPNKKRPRIDSPEGQRR